MMLRSWYGSERHVDDDVSADFLYKRRRLLYIVRIHLRDLDRTVGQLFLYLFTALQTSAGQNDLRERLFVQNTFVGNHPADTAGPDNQNCRHNPSLK